MSCSVFIQWNYTEQKKKKKKTDGCYIDQRG